MLVVLLSSFTSLRTLLPAVRPRPLLGLLVGVVFALTSLGCSSYITSPKEEPAGRRPGPAPVDYRYIQPRQSFVLSPSGTRVYRGAAAESPLYARADWPVADEISIGASVFKKSIYREYFYSDDRTGSGDLGYYRQHHRVVGTSRYTHRR